ncbi:rhodanese-like domain-containing protein [Patescibacteria group bacterium]
MGGVKEITSDDLKALMDKGADFLLIDLLGEKSYESLHVPQAVPVQPGDGFVERVDALTGGDHGKQVIVYAANFADELSTKMTWELLAAGYENTLDFKGGLKDWAAELYPLEGKRVPKK